MMSWKGRPHISLQETKRFTTRPASTDIKVDTSSPPLPPSSRSLLLLLADEETERDFRYRRHMMEALSSHCIRPMRQLYCEVMMARRRQERPSVSPATSPKRRPDGRKSHAFIGLSGGQLSSSGRESHSTKCLRMRGATNPSVSLESLRRARRKKRPPCRLNITLKRERRPLP